MKATSLARKMTKPTNRPTKRFQVFVATALRLGARRAMLIRPAKIVTGSWVRWKCQFGCGGYNSSRMCPPHTPTPEQTRRMLDEYQRGILFEAPRNVTRKIAARLERAVFLAGYYKALGLGSGPCPLCQECAFEEACRHPDEARPAMEACGIDVFATARQHGCTIDVVRRRDDPQHYFGLVLIE
jgi:predicted metal-binding protein